MGPTKAPEGGWDRPADRLQLPPPQQQGQRRQPSLWTKNGPLARTLRRQTSTLTSRKAHNARDRMDVTEARRPASRASSLGYLSARLGGCSLCSWRGAF